MSAVWLLAYMISQSEALSLRNCSKMILPVEPMQAYDAAVRGAQYLANHIRDDGTFDYLYFPDLDESTQSSYMFRRHVGSLYGLFEVYGSSKDEEMLSRGKLALKFFVKRIVPCKGELCLDDSHGEASIGGTGIALMTLAAYQRATNDQTYKEVMHQLASWILMQQREDGSFEDHDLDIKTGEIQEQRNPYGLGEALLSVIQLYKMEGDKKYLHAVSRGLHALFQTPDDSLLVSSTHWLGPTIRLTHEAEPDQRYLDYTVRLVHGLKGRMTEHPLCGPQTEGTCWRPNSCACMTDGSTASWAILQSSHRAKDASFALGVLKHWLTYVMQSHIDPKTSGRFPNPTLAVGGLKGPNDYVRIDDVSHASTALLAYSEAAKLLGTC